MTQPAKNSGEILASPLASSPPNQLHMETLGNCLIFSGRLSIKNSMGVSARPKHTVAGKGLIRGLA